MNDTASRSDLPRVELAYRILSGDDADERVCRAIPEEACTNLPRNFVLNVANGAATKLAEQLASPGLVLPWLFSAIGAPAALAGLLMPAKQAGSLVPQLAIAGWVRSVPRRKWVWVTAGAAQAAMLALIAVAATAFAGAVAGAIILILFLAFSMLSGMGSVAFQDVVGKTVPQGRRGRLLSARATLGGALTLAAALALQAFVAGERSLSISVPLVLGAAVLWATGALLFAALIEQAGETGGGRSMIGEIKGGVRRLRTISGFRRYIAVRALLLGVELAMPFYALHASALLGAHAPTLAVFILAVGAAQILSSPFWGVMSDARSQTVLMVAGAFGAAAGLGAALIAAVPALQSAWLYALLFLVVGVAEAGVRLGRKTYLVDAAPGPERPLYVAFSNTVVGGLAIAGGLLGVLADLVGPLAAILVTAAAAAAGAVACLALPAAEEMVGRAG